MTNRHLAAVLQSLSRFCLIGFALFMLKGTFAVFPLRRADRVKEHLTEPQLGGYRARSPARIRASASEAEVRKLRDRGFESHRARLGNSPEWAPFARLTSISTSMRLLVKP